MKRLPFTSMAALCGLVAALAAIAATLGIFARGTGEFVTATSARGETYDMATTGVYAWNAQRVVAEGVGWDVVTLVLAVPALLFAARLVARGSYRGRLFAAGLLGYFLYAYLEYAVTWALGPLFVLFVAIYAASLLGLAWIGWSLAVERPTESLADGFPRRGWAALNFAMSGLLGMLWLQRISLALGGDVSLLDGETTMTVQALDLGLMIPISVLAGVLVLRRVEIGYALAAAFGVTFVTMTTAITAMLLSAWAVEGTLEVVPVAIFTVASAASLALLLRTYRVISPGAARRSGARPARAGATR
jgi:hypothetical protein